MKYQEETLRVMRETGEVDWRPLKDSKIAEFYRNKNVLVTGATGFLGKLLLEKLLRACPDLKTIFILVRPKKGEDEVNRVEKICSEVIFNPLSKLHPKFQHKITILKGDLLLPNLGLSDSHIAQIKQEVNIIFHVAATVRFDEKLTTATAINIRSTRDLLQIAKDTKNLHSFVYISTAFANCLNEEIDEIFYKPPITADELITKLETESEEKLIKETPKLIKNWPNTYTFTKAIAEQAVAAYGGGLPICIIRPSVVIATYREPLRNWIDNIYGATGVLIGAGIGLIKTIYCDKNKTAEMIPGDYVINTIIAASYQTTLNQITKDIKIYNCVSSAENRQTWGQLMENSQKWGLEIPTIRCVWYYCLTTNKYYFMHLLYSMLFHFLPAILMDLGMILTRQKPIMIKIYKKINKFESVLSYFCTNDWRFRNENTRRLWSGLGESDRQMFPFSMGEFSWEDFYKTHMLGLRLYICKDDISTLPQAGVKWRRFYVAHQVVKGLIYFVFVYGLYWVLKKVFGFVFV